MSNYAEQDQRRRRRLVLSSNEIFFLTAGDLAEESWKEDSGR